MAMIVPTITSESKEEFAKEVERVADFAKRIHVDFADGKFAPTKLVMPVQAWWFDDQEADLHVMFENPEAELMTLVSLQPRLIIIHSESKGDLKAMIDEIKTMGIMAGIAVLPKTKVADIKELIEVADHALIFGGKLGYHGGTADLKQLDKIAGIKAINAEIEIGWDGGVNEKNAKQIAEAGVDCLNTGGGIQHADNPEEAYNSLQKILSS